MTLIGDAISWLLIVISSFVVLYAGTRVASMAYFKSKLHYQRAVIMTSYEFNKGERNGQSADA